MYSFITQINGDGSLDFEEFIRILRHLSPDYFKKNTLRQLSKTFEKYAEFDVDSNEKVLECDTFPELCQAEGLFTSQKDLDQFHQKRDSKGLARSYEDLVKNWDKIGAELAERVDEIGNENLAIYFDRIKIKILKANVTDKMMIWMNYKILEAELDRLVCEYKIFKYCMPSHLFIIHRNYTRLM